MDANERHGVTGRVTIQIMHLDRGETEIHRFDNLITISGRKYVADYFAGNLVGKPRYEIAVGDGNSEPLLADTKLNNELDTAKAAVAIRIADGLNRADANFIAKLPPLETNKPAQELKEAGIRAIYPQGDGEATLLYNRVVFPVITRTDNTELTFAWEVTF